MKRDEILMTVQEICRDIFDLDQLIISDETNASQISQWDSLNHLNLVSAIEDEFNLKFTFEEIASFKNIGSILDSIIRKG